MLIMYNILLSLASSYIGYRVFIDKDPPKLPSFKAVKIKHLKPLVQINQPSDETDLSLFQTIGLSWSVCGAFIVAKLIKQYNLISDSTDESTPKKKKRKSRRRHSKKSRSKKAKIKYV